MKKMTPVNTPLQSARIYVEMEGTRRGFAIYGRAALAVVKRAFGAGSDEARDFAVWQKEGRRLAGEFFEVTRIHTLCVTGQFRSIDQVYAAARSAVFAHYGLHNFTVLA